MTAPRCYPVPAGTREATCRGCDAPIYWIVNANDKKVPIDCEADGMYPPTPRDAGVRWAVADHPATPAATLERLADDPDPTVRRAAARQQQRREAE